MSSERALEALHALRDVPGVLGSFLWGQDGKLLAADLTPARPQPELQAITSRLSRLVEAHANAGEWLQSVTLRFESHRLHICGVAEASLAVLLATTSHMPALKLALEHVLRGLSQLPELSAGAARPVAASAAAPGSARSYRGQRIIE